jgi:integrase
LDDLDRFRVHKVPHTGGHISYWIFTPDAELHRPAMEVLKGHPSSTQETYAYSLVDHLNWAYINGKTPDSVTFDDLLRYMKGVSAQTDGIYGLAWRKPSQKPLGTSAASNVATIVKAYYLNLAASGQIGTELAGALKSRGFATLRRGSGRVVEANPLAPTKQARRPRFLDDSTVEALFERGVLTSNRDVMIVTWLHDGGMRVGGLCGLRFSDLHLVRHHPCGQRADPHIHIIGRDDNPNGARAKSFGPSGLNLSSDGYVVDGVIRAVSPDMISTFHAYLLDEYYPLQALADHDQILIHVSSRTPGAALSTSGVRKMLRRSCKRAGLSRRITPHAFRHKAAAAFYAATDFNAEMVAQEFGWATPEMVTDLYGKSANRDAMAYLSKAWDATARPPGDQYPDPERSRVDA